MAPHMTHLSVALQEAVMKEAGCPLEWVVLHWISSLAFLPICGTDVPVSGAYCAWRFGCMHPLFLENRDMSLDGDLDAECWVFWQVLGSDSSRLGRRLAG